MAQRSVCYLYIPLWLPLARALQNQHGLDSARCQKMKSNNTFGCRCNVDARSESWALLICFFPSILLCLCCCDTSSCIRLTLITLWSGCIWRSNDDKIHQWNPSFCVLMTKSRDWTCCWSDQMTFALINRWFVQSHANYFWVWRPFSKRFLSVLFQVVYLAHRVITLIGLTTSKLATKKSRHYWSTQFRQNRLKPVRT